MEVCVDTAHWFDAGVRSAGLGRQEPTKKEYARFEGVWSFAVIDVEGTKQPVPPFESNKIIIAQDGLFTVVQGPKVTRGIFKLDPSKIPKHFDQTVTDGPAKGMTAACIYELEGDTYMLCGSFRGKDRPATFDSKPKSGLIVQSFKREKQVVKEALIEVGRRELSGTWQAISYALDGTKASDEDMKRIKLVIDADGHATALREGKVFIAAATDIDPTKTPITIDFSYTEGDIKGKTALGIYKIENDLLTICRTSPGDARPTEFTSKPGSGHTLMTYRRETTPPK
jgi:uncharacterized protein (TIGR03067 family)